jgi:hypothetical protein
MSGKKLEGALSYLNPLAEHAGNLKEVRPRNAEKAEEFMNLDYLLELFKYRSLLRIFDAAKVL